MTAEYLNNHTHDAGRFHFDWDYSTDASVDIGTQTLNAAANDGLTADEVLEFIKTGTDFGQLTIREARQLSAELRRHYPQMSPDAKAIAEKFDATLQERVEDLHDCSDERLSGSTHQPWIWGLDLNYEDQDLSVTEGKDLNSFFVSLDSVAHPREMIGMMDVGDLGGVRQLPMRG